MRSRQCKTTVTAELTHGNTAAQVDAFDGGLRIWSTSTVLEGVRHKCTESGRTNVAEDLAGGSSLVWGGEGRIGMPSELLHKHHI